MEPRCHILHCYHIENVFFAILFFLITWLALFIINKQILIVSITFNDAVKIFLQHLTQMVSFLQNFEII